ncbi:MAG: hypothetical protein Q8O87_00140 [bacterium]|nr:hypothetical protein [bacterium]
MKYLSYKTLLLGVIVSGALLTLPRFDVYAQSEALKSALKVVVDVKDEKVETLESRRTALLKILDLSRLEVEELMAKLSAIDVLEDEYIELQGQFSEDLESYIMYFDSLEDALINNSLTQKELQLLAADFKTWHEEYNINVKKIANFIWTFREADLLIIAKSRLNKISVDIKRFRSSKVIKISALTPPLANAAAALQEAEVLNKQAQNLLLATTTPPIAEDEETPPTIGELIEAALNKIKDAYKEFFKMSALLKEMLGL